MCSKYPGDKIHFHTEQPCVTFASGIVQTLPLLLWTP